MPGYYLVVRAARTLGMGFRALLEDPCRESLVEMALACEAGEAYAQRKRGG